MSEPDAAMALQSDSGFAPQRVVILALPICFSQLSQLFLSLLFRSRGLVVLISVLLIPLLLSGPVRANPVTTAHAQVELISETTAIQAGQPFWLAFRLTAQPGWHTYWRNPGDSGLATRLTWTLPPGFSAGEIQWPYPERVAVGPLMNFGYHGAVALLTQIQPPPTLAAGQALSVRVRGDWLICQEDCIPEEAVLELSLPVSAEPAPPDPRWSVLFAATRRLLPVAAPWSAHYRLTPEALALSLDAGPAVERVTAVEFFPFADGVIEHAAPQTLRRAGAELQLSVARGTLQELPPTLAGVVVVREQLEDGAVSASAFTLAAAPAPTSAATPTFSGLQLAQMLILALLGGLLLNLMPCVFPVLSLKALGLAQHAHHAPGAVRAHGLAYVAGVLLCFALIAALLIALRAVGQQLGWGFQLQSPSFITLLAYLLFALGLSLSGVFHLGDRLMGVGSAWADRPGYGGSFATGALAVVVATPCTAPFMGAAVGFALTQPWWVSLSVFEFLGLGLALPYLALSLWPTLLRFLPRPGAWLERAKQLLAFPLYATAAWLVWVLSQQAGPDGVAVVLAGMILIAFAIWLGQSSRDAGQRSQRLGRIGATLALLLALALAWWPSVENPDASSASAAAVTSSLPSEPFSAARVAELRAAGQPVLVNFTAAWCITCLVNERVALSSARVAEALRAQNVAYLKGDWTRRDPAITAALAEFGRAGVPLYVLYRPGAAEPTILPQLLTESLLLETLQSLLNPS